MAAGRTTWLPFLHYPAVMTATFAVFALMRAAGASLVASTYIPVLLAAALVTLLELWFPHRNDWRPPASEVRTDLGFMAVVQLAFPPLVGFVFTYALIEPARALHLPVAALWPHAWPTWAQAVLMVLVVDLLVLAASRRARERYALAPPLGAPFRRAAVLVEHGALSLHRESAADDA